jgi:hypothetical protein
VRCASAPGGPIELILGDQPFSQKQVADARRFSGRAAKDVFFVEASCVLLAKFGTWI